MRAIEGLQKISAVLRGCGIEESSKEAEIIMTCCTGLERVAFYRDDPVLSRMQWEAVERVLERRNRREPLQYVLGHADFYGLKIRVGPGVLIPRPETELIVEEMIRTVDSLRSTVGGRLKILDLCTGSGCLALAFAKQFENAEVVAIDSSERTLDYAGENAKINGIKNVTFLKGDLYAPVKGRRFDVIASNPPYIKRTALSGLSPEIMDWEPVEALDGGEDGLEFYRKILACSSDYLALHGFLIFELGYGEARDVIKIAERSGFKPVSLIRDYSGIERVLRLALR